MVILSRKDKKNFSIHNYFWVRWGGERDRNTVAYGVYRDYGEIKEFREILSLISLNSFSRRFLRALRVSAFAFFSFGSPLPPLTTLNTLYHFPPDNLPHSVLHRYTVTHPCNGCNGVTGIMGSLLLSS